MNLIFANNSSNIRLLLFWALLTTNMVGGWPGPFSATSIWADETVAHIAPTPWAEIQIVDEETDRGVPLVELETVNGVRLVTDNAGRIAIQEPGWLDHEVYFSIKSHGYEFPKDGFGYTGVRITPQVGQPVVLKIKRKNLAERCVRLTGEGLYRDSLLLGYKIPPSLAKSSGRVAGQDSIQATIYRDQIYWLWGDTQRMEYPLGLFRMAGATTPLPPGEHGFDPAGGIPYHYFVDEKTGFARAMMPLAARPEGVVWIGSIFVVPDDHGVQKLVGYYSRRKGLTEAYEQGIAIFNDDSQTFEIAREIPLTETWRFPNGHPITYEDQGQTWLLFGSPHPNVRVPIKLAAVLDPNQYEAFTCADAEGKVARTEGAFRPHWRWQQELPPTDSKQESRWFKSNELGRDELRYLPVNVADDKELVQLHSGTVRWNRHREKWILIACQIEGRSSFLGEVWYAEASEPTGPFASARKIVTHDRQTFYNVCHHDFLDRENGRFIYFEGTYTNDFSGNPDKTPRYNYNQVLYRLDLEKVLNKEAQRTRRGEGKN